MNKTITLRPYQSKLVTQVKTNLSNDQDALIEQPTGSGKSVAISTICASLFHNNFSHIIIAVPQEQIEDGFVVKENDKQIDFDIEYPTIDGSASTKISINHKLFRKVRENKKDSISSSLKRYLQNPANNIYICTHASLCLANKNNILPEDLLGYLLVIDEAHHSKADGLDNFIEEWENKGGKLLFATATPYRTDGANICRENMKVFRRPLHEHMEEGFAPNTLNNEIVAVNADDVSASEFTGEEIENSNHRELIINAICDAYERDNKPKAIIRIPPGKSEDFVSDLSRIFKQRFGDVRILNGVGVDEQIKNEFVKKLAQEKNKDYYTSNYDIVVGVQRVLEGTDWSVCSHVYCVGIPGSLTIVTQLIGRALRKKTDNHPNKDAANISFFVLGANENALSKLDIKHSRHTLLNCIFLADYNTGKEWIVTKAISKGISAGLNENIITSEQEEEYQNSIRETELPDDKADSNILILSAIDNAVSNNESCDLDYVITYAKNNGLDIPYNLEQQFVEHLSTKESVSESVKVKAKELAKNKIQLLPNVDKYKRDLFYELADEFRKETLVECESIIGFVNQIHKVTGGQIGDFCKRLVSSDVCYSLEQLRGWVKNHFNKTGKYPSKLSGNIEDTNTNWNKISAYLNRNTKGLVGYKSLADYLFVEFGKINTFYTLNEVENWCNIFYTKNGKYPNCDSGDIEGQNIKWSHINDYFRSGSRGLVGYKCLCDFLEKKCGKQNIIYSTSQINGWILKYFNENGKFPSSSSSDYIENENIRWSDINNYFRSNLRGLFGYTGLKNFIDKEFNRQDIIYTIEQVKKWAQYHYNKTKKYPTVQSGLILEANVTWCTINGYFIHKSRGLVGYNSLSHFIKNEFNRTYNINQVKDWIVDFYDKNSKYPLCNSGNILGTDMNWNKVNAYFRRQSRGLVGYESLSDFIKKEFKS